MPYVYACEARERNDVLYAKEVHFIRENPSGGQPESVLEADFDIVHKETALMVPDAEVLKVVEEVLDELPPLKAAGFYFVVNHAGIADLILDSCRVPTDVRNGVMVTLSSLGRGTSFATIRNVLKLKFRLQRSVLDELSIFNVQGKSFLFFSFFSFVLSFFLLEKGN